MLSNNYTIFWRNNMFFGMLFECDVAICNYFLQYQPYFLNNYLNLAELGLKYLLKFTPQNQTIKSAKLNCSPQSVVFGATMYTRDQVRFTHTREHPTFSFAYNLLIAKFLDCKESSLMLFQKIFRITSGQKVGCDLDVQI